MGLFTVYKHTSPSGKIYIGITSKKPEHRWNHGRAYWHNKHFTNAINSYGWDNFKHEILFEGLTKEEACKKEIELIAKYKSNETEFGYNQSTGGEYSNKGAKPSKELIARRAKANTGKKRTSETCLAISAAKRGRSNGHEGMMGERNAKSGIVLQINEATKEIVASFYGYDEMNRKTGFAKTPVKEAANGMRKRAYGYLWEYQKRGNCYGIV